MTAQVTAGFRGERLIVPTIRRGRIETIGAWLRLVIVGNLRSLIRRGPLYWRLGPKAPPVSIDRITVGERQQLGSSIPADLFTLEAAPAFDMDPAAPGAIVSITVTNLSRKPFFFRCTLIGWTTIRLGPPLNSDDWRKKREAQRQNFDQLLAEAEKLLAEGQLDDEIEDD